MNRWVDDIRTALENLGGIAHRSEILKEVQRIRPGPHPPTIVQTIQRTIQNHSSDSAGFRDDDLFYTVQGIGSGIWGLRKLLSLTPIASDLDEIDVSASPRVAVETYRILRDTDLARKIKMLHRNTCQLCGMQLMLADGSSYAEAHHIQPLGAPHHGPDISENIVVLCPNHHVQLDYGAFQLQQDELQSAHGHRIASKFIEYHNQHIYKAIRASG